MCDNTETTIPDDTHYTHLRAYEDVNVGMYVDTVLSNKGGATVAWRYDDKNKRIIGAIARCSRKDNFSRKFGRILAKARLDDEMQEENYLSIPYSLITASQRGPKFREVADFFFNTVKV
jgi:hypothetical protein